MAFLAAAFQWGFRKKVDEGLYYVYYPLFPLTVSRESLVFLLGVIIFVIPLIGVPPLWKEYALIAIGVLLVALGFSLRRSAYYRRIDRGNGELGNDSFVESQPSLLEYTPEEVELEDEK